MARRRESRSKVAEHVGARTAAKKVAPARSRRNNFYIVGIGGSAGSLSAVPRYLSTSCDEEAGG